MAYGYLKWLALFGIEIAAVVYSANKSVDTSGVDLRKFEADCGRIVKHPAKKRNVYSFLLFGDFGYHRVAIHLLFGHRMQTLHEKKYETSRH